MTARDHGDLAVGVRGDGRVARRLGQNRKLPDRIAGTDRCEFAATALDGRAAGKQDEHIVAALAFDHQRRALSDLASVGELGDQAQLALRARGEERHIREHSGDRGRVALGATLVRPVAVRGEVLADVEVIHGHGRTVTLISPIYSTPCLAQHCPGGIRRALA